MEVFHPLIRRWFTDRFGEPTKPQTLGWPQIAAGNNTLIAAPTGSGKTLAAFLVCLDRLWRDWLAGKLHNGIRVVYISPLKALSNDIDRNLQTPLGEIRQLAADCGYDPPPIRTAVRTGDTPSSARQKMLRQPPHVLVTTPESLYLLLTAEKSREILKSVDTVIVDEIHALARDKRGSHLALSLERLTELCEQPPTRIGLSATQRPIEDIARFLVGSDAQVITSFNRDPSWSASQSGALPDGSQLNAGPHSTEHSVPTTTRTPQHSSLSPSVHIIDAGHARDLDLAVDVPASELSAVCSHEQWGEVYERLVELINTHRSTLIFVNTRRLAERVSHHLRELLGEEAVAGHHGSLAKELRLTAEQKLKSGELKAIVATASLEMGIDIGYIDLVCQIGSPRAIATFLQRVGRSGHSLGKTPKGRLFPLTRDELLESMALIRAVNRGRLDAIEIPQAPLDILAQQIVASAACEEWDEESLFEMCRRAWPYRDLTRKRFEEVLELLANGVTPSSKRGAYLHRDRINGRVRARRNARLAAITSGGAIPETAEYRVVVEPDKTFVGTVDEDFAIESLAGDVFLLGNMSWRVQYVRSGQVVVRDAEGAPPSIPFWFGEGPGRTIELSEEVSRLRSDIVASLSSITLQLAGGSRGTSGEGVRATDTYDDASPTERPPRSLDSDPPASGRVPCSPHSPSEESGAAAGLSDLESDDERNDPSRTAANITRSTMRDCGVNAWAAQQASNYIESQAAALGVVPTKDEIVYERFFDESGGMQLVIHSPFGARINRAWGLAMRKRFCRSFDFELQAAATDNGILLSLSPQHSSPIDSLFKMLGPHNARDLLEQSVLVAPMFQVRWRWNITRALAVLRTQGSKRVPPHLQRFRSDDLLASAFPETVGCLENHHGDVEIPDHPLVQQTMHDCLTEAMDVERWIGVLQQIKDGAIQLIPRDTREPSPFCHELLNANPYAFLDDAPLEERRTRAVSTRRTFTAEDVRDLAKLDPAAISQVCEEARPIVRDADELHDTLVTLAAVPSSEAASWQHWFDELVAERRASMVEVGNRSFMIASERWPLIRAVYEGAVADPQIKLPAELDLDVERTQGWIELVRGRMQFRGPITVAGLADELGLERSQVDSSLEALESQGIVLRGRFTTAAISSESSPSEWCDRRLLARIHRVTLEGLRQRIKPVSPDDYMRYLIRRHRVGREAKWGGAVGVREAIAQLQGFEMPAGAWESRILAARCDDYDPQWLDQLFLSGEVTWGRLRTLKRDDDKGRGNGAITRAMPISLMLREDLSWLVSDPRAFNDKPVNADCSAESLSLSGYAQQVLEALHQRGALFAQELKTTTGLLPSHLEEALRELAACGFVTSDAFAAVRAIAGQPTAKRNGRRRKAASGMALPAGRWSLFPGSLEEPSRDERLEQWARLLLRRYGVLFRDLLARENASPAWHELVRVLRRLELRGEIRGGRFVSGVGGEQFAEDNAISELRASRETEPDDSWILLCGADPLNLAGVILPGARVTANQKNYLILQAGCCIAAKQAGQIEFFAEVDRETEASMRRALQTGRLDAQDHIRARWLAEDRKPRSLPELSTAVPSRSLRQP